MATHDYVLDNATGANFRADLNLVLAAIVSNNSSSSEPSTKYAYQWWADTNEGVLKIRNSANNAWITLLQLDGTLTLEDGSASAPALGFRDDLNTGIFSSGADTLDVTCGGTTRGSFSSSGLAVTGNVSATTFVGNVDAVDGDFDGTLEADAITVAGVALNTVIAGVASTNVTVADESSDTTCFPLFVTAATGDLPPKSGSNLAFNSSNGTLTATAFAGDGSALTGVGGTTINNNADNRVITGSGSANTLEGESGLTFSSNTLSINTNGSSIAENNLRFESGGKAFIDHATTGQDIDIRTSVSSSLDTTGITIKSTGNLAFASGKGIDFSATSGTGTSELFDDYEEGTFTPEYNSGSASSACYASGESYSAQVGVYRKVGHVVHFIIKIQVSSGTLKSGLLQINNLPFTSGDFSSFSIAGGAFLSYTTGYFSDTAHIPTIFVSPGTAFLRFFNTAGNNFAGTHLAQATGRLDINGHYFTS